MSLIGIDIGTSGVKVGAYTEDGRLHTHTRVPVRPARPRPGWEELDPRTVWAAVRTGLRRVAAAPALRGDPPRAMAISASGDEAFPVDQQGRALGPCILSGDVRGAAIEERTLSRHTPERWYQLCGHVPERMDPVNRLHWWREHQPGALAGQVRFLGWHEFAALLLTGTAATDPTLAAKWLVYDLARGDWSEERLREWALDRGMLPAVLPWGTPIGEVNPRIAARLGLPPGLVVGVGSYDSACAALGAGAVESGAVGLAVGSWEVVVAPCGQPQATEPLVAAHLPIVPYAGEPSYAVLAQSPNGAAVADWAGRLVHVPHGRLPNALAGADPGPGPVMAIPHLSGALSHREGGRDSRGALLGMTHATTAVDVIRAILEGIAYDLALTVAALRAAGIAVSVLRGSGGGTRSDWWMQLKSDLAGVPVEVSGVPEPGTLGAALLAGVAAGVYRSVGEASTVVQQTARRFEPNPDRAERHAERLALYRQAVKSLVSLNRGLLT